MKTTHLSTITDLRLPDSPVALLGSLYPHPPPNLMSSGAKKPRRPPHAPERPGVYGGWNPYFTRTKQTAVCSTGRTYQGFAGNFGYFCTPLNFCGFGSSIDVICWSKERFHIGQLQSLQSLINRAPTSTPHVSVAAGFGHILRVYLLQQIRRTH